MIEIHIGYFAAEKHRFDTRLGWGSLDRESLRRFSMAYSLFPFGSGLKPYLGFGFGFQSAGFVYERGSWSLVSGHLGIRKRVGGRGSVFLETKSNLVFDRNSKDLRQVTTWLQIVRWILA